MQFTLWGRGRLLGETDLGFIRVRSSHRMGWFHPSPLGDRLMPILTGTGPALRAVGKLMSDPVRTAIRSRQRGAGEEWPPDIRATTEYADLVSSVDELECMQLQIRDAAGAILSTCYIGIDDTMFKLSFLSKRQRRHWKSRWKAAPHGHERSFLRYQIQVDFTEGRSATFDEETA